ncbi:UNVERIFIED_CONTAM: hypothetical protein FKN15_034467 [Acipenser sinensis]
MTFSSAGCAAEECAVAVSQPNFTEVSEESETVTIHCNFTSSGQCPSIPEVLWYHFQQHSHRKLQTHSSNKYSLEQSGKNWSLRISYIHPNDSGIYFCGISFTKSDSIHSKNTSTGTILVVRAGCAAEECAVAVSQPNFIEVSEESETVTIHCNFTSSGQCPSIPEVLWYHFQQHSHRKLQTHSSNKYSLEQSGKNWSLRISYIHPNDSGIYFCGISFTKSDSIHSKNTSTGTILVVRGTLTETRLKLKMAQRRRMTTQEAIDMLAALSKNDSDAGNNKNSTRRANFRAVAQELYNQRNPRKNRKAVSV